MEGFDIGFLVVLSLLIQNDYAFLQNQRLVSKNNLLILALVAFQSHLIEQASQQTQQISIVRDSRGEALPFSPAFDLYSSDEWGSTLKRPRVN